MASNNRKNIVPCLLWVKQGCAKQKPDKVLLDKDELKKIIESAQDKLGDLEEAEATDEENGKDENEEEEEDEFAAAVKKAQSMAETIKQKKTAGKRKHDESAGEAVDEIVDKYGLDEYDNDEAPMNFLHGIGTLTPFASNAEDPYITLKNEDDDSDDEDFVLRPDDNLIAVGRVTDEAAILEVHVYNADKENLFIHHDYVLPTFPLVLEWLDYDPADGSTGNFLAMGTMEPDISVWDLDVVDSLEPVLVLEGVKPMKGKKKKMKKRETLSAGHSDAVLDLSWNANQRNVLASASADQTVCLWDLSVGQTVASLTHHSKQVQCVKWHPQEAQSLLTGSFDNSAAIVDCRNPSENVKKWALQGEVERTLWNHFNPFQFLASTDQGKVYCMDIRKEKPVYTLSAHDQAVTGLSLSSQIEGLLVTTSPDKQLKVWDIQNDSPNMVFSRNLKMDILHCVSCNPDHPFVFAVGANKDFKVWDIRESAAVRRHFLTRMPKSLAEQCDGDDDDVPVDLASEAMENLTVGDEEDEKEEEEMLAGDRGTTEGAKQKKKRKKKKKKPTAVGDS